MPLAFPPLPFSPTRLRSYILRLPLFTRTVLIAIVTLCLLDLQPAWSVARWGALKPSEVSLMSMHRLNTYPIVHQGFIHAFLNILALTPLLERFEAEYGTLTSLAMFFGPLSTFPGGLYILVEKCIFRQDTAILGSSIWVFLLLASEAMKTYASNPHFSLGTYKIPTWATPLIGTIFVSALIPNTSFVGHLCGIAVGYALGLGYLKILFPPEKILRWVESKLNLLGILPHYVSVDQKTYGRYGILPTGNSSSGPGTTMSYFGSTQRLGP
ncbi:rhomboid protein 2 [Coccidioides immitis RS]|uniref:rhomboid protease n=3 Tax=Coccidioides TaxID=5500 RepID=J3KJS0_COCIM|nr:rhomboid protein 2 [Coccidioides immitis RS]EAS36353.3 rhomboid protein 2 [Coccidioides immitis RS]KMM64763.1 rhomboid protein 2 [Coccidioides posadasii RMSCC 3488]KMP01705.1 rhomboid protein 2 [Coccidioides immitis RMSCC 2394]